MKRIACLMISLTACFLSSVSMAVAQAATTQAATTQAVTQDTIALSFAIPSTESSVMTPPPDSDAGSDFGQAAPAPPQNSQPPQVTIAPAEAISFNLPEAANAAPVPKPEAEATPLADASTDASTDPSAEIPSDAALFAGGSESVVARTVGHAEGTRSANGGKNPGYYGHADPGNGVWNRGTFSYQFGNAENLQPEEADQRQLDRIKGHYDRSVAPKAQQLGLRLSLKEKLNAIDLANQAPLAVTESGGFVERLAAAKQEKKLEPDQATLDARVWSFWDGKKGGWDAPGLRAYDDVSKEESIRQDQDRRMKAISEALQEYTQEQKAKQPAPQRQAIVPLSTGGRLSGG